MAEQNGIFIASHLAPEMHEHLVSAFPRADFIAESHDDPDHTHSGMVVSSPKKLAIFTSAKVQVLAMILIGFVDKYRVN